MDNFIEALKLLEECELLLWMGSASNVKDRKALHDKIKLFRSGPLKVDAEYKVVDGKAYAILRRDAKTGKTAPCPFCGTQHIHGGDEGHRTAHCVPSYLYKLNEKLTPIIQSGEFFLNYKDGYFVMAGKEGQHEA